MGWLERTVSEHGHRLVGQVQSGDVALVCTALELLGWDGQSESRVALSAIKRFSREGRDLLVLGDAPDALMRLAILSVPRPELDAFFGVVKAAMAEARGRKVAVTSPAAPAPAAQAPISQVPTSLAPAAPAAASMALPVSSPAAVAQAPAVSSVQASAPAAGEFFWSGELSPLAAIAPAAETAPAPAVEAVATLPSPDPNASLSEQDRDAFTLGLLQMMERAEAPPTMMDFMLESAQAPIAQTARAAAPVVPGLAIPVLAAAEPVLPSAPPREVAPQGAPRAQVTADQAPRDRERLSRRMSHAAESAPVVTPEAPVLVGRDGGNRSAPKLEGVFSDPLLAPAPRERVMSKLEREQDLGGGVFEHPDGFKYELSSVRRRFAALFVDSFLLGIVTGVLERMASSGADAKEARANEIVRQLLGGRSIPGELSEVFKATLLDKTATLDPASPETALILEYRRIMESLPAEQLVGSIIAVLLVALAGWAYYAYFESGPNHATPGKKWLGIGVVDLNVRPVSFAHASKRYWWRFGPIYGVGLMGTLIMLAQLRGGPNLVGALIAVVLVVLAGALSTTDFLVAFFTKKRQTFHDLMAGTLVVKG